jgi:OmpA-OmpF porin, OOP family
VIRPSSTYSLQVVVDVLRSRTGNYYIVGHTDDTGAFDFNMALSFDRAASVIAALTGDYSIDPVRLQPGGVGPKAPIASNDNDTGRQLNRRVELVWRLGE